ncbi:hypothetical protein [Thermus caldilimi]|uniref:hypothetical protein n=1 Tax=Thermus caldilimi TaxID=2483360 RepID=UPI00107626DB|nr:hypothetical protein [Thermus caldilimi]
MKFPLWARVLLWAEVPLVFFLNLWYTPYAILLAWGVPLLWERWFTHLETLEELAYVGEFKKLTEATSGEPTTGKPGE